MALKVAELGIQTRKYFVMLLVAIDSVLPADLGKTDFMFSHDLTSLSEGV
jgi:hypothetical protein